MASCQTKQWVSTSPYVRLTVTQTSSTATSSTLSWTLEYIASSAANTSVAKEYVVSVGYTTKTGTYNIDGKTGTNTIASGTETITKTTSAQMISFGVKFSFNLTWSGVYKGAISSSSSIYVPAKTSYTIAYNANGGSGAPGSQTKWHGTALILSSTKPTRNGHKFLGWGTSASATTVAYVAGGGYTANASTTLYAVWQAATYNVSYNANGGSGAPGTQIKIYDRALTLSNTKPTRARYTFKGWGTSASATTVAYAAGASYTANSAITLYAVWERAYNDPRIVNISVSRCDSNGSITDEGMCAKVSFDWETDLSISSCMVGWLLNSQEIGVRTITVTGTSGTATCIIGTTDLDLELTYDVRIVVSDASGSTTVTTILPSMRLAFDALAEAKGIAFGKTATLENTAEFEYDAKFNKPVYGKALGMDRLPGIPANSDFNNYMDPGCYAVHSNANADTISNIPVTRAGRLEVWSATGEGVRSEQWSYLRQRFVPYNIANAVWERDITRSEDNVWNYGEWSRTSITPAASKKVYHEQKILWSGARYMTETHTIALAEAVSEQPNGIVLVFSKYSNGAAIDNNFNSFFIPKIFINSFTGYGNAFTMMDADFGQICHKYLYINNTTISGHAGNGVAGTGASGIKYDNSKFALRYVLGV